MNYNRGVRTPYYLNHPGFPCSSPKYQRTYYRQRGKRYHHRHKYTAGAKSHSYTEHIGKGNFPKPKHKKIDDRWRPCIASAVEGLPQNHSVGVKEKSISNNSQTIHAVLRYVRIVCVEPNNLWCEDDKSEANNAKEDHVVESGLPHSSFRSIRIARTQCLPNHCCRGIRHSPRWQKREQNHPYAERVTCHRIASKA